MGQFWAFFMKNLLRKLKSPPKKTFLHHPSLLLQAVSFVVSPPSLWFFYFWKSFFDENWSFLDEMATLWPSFCLTIQALPVLSCCFWSTHPWHPPCLATELLASWVHHQHPANMGFRCCASQFLSPANWGGPSSAPERASTHSNRTHKTNKGAKGKLSWKKMFFFSFFFKSFYTP